MIEIILIIGFIGFGLWLYAVPLTEEEKKIDIKKEYEYKVGEENGN
jgi:hypothetical protein